MTQGRNTKEKKETECLIALGFLRIFAGFIGTFMVYFRLFLVNHRVSLAFDGASSLQKHL